MATREITFKFLGDSKSLSKGADAAGKSMDKVGKKTDAIAKKMSKFGKGLSVGVSLPIVAAFTAGFNSLRENEELLAQTNAVLKSMGDGAGVTSEAVFDLANSISGMSGLAHENVVEGQNMLLTFGNIRNELGEGNDIFDQTTRIMADMSVATGQDMASAAVGLGKALNDPIVGITALAKQGVSFTEEQKEMIRTLVESGDTMGAQKIILGELESQFGGSAEALGGTMTGSINKMKNSFEELTRNLAEAVVPILMKLTGVLQSVLSWFNNLSPGVKKLLGPLALAVAAIGPLLIVGAKLVQSFKTIMAAFKLLNLAFLTNPFFLLAIAIVALVVLVVLNWDKIVAFILAAWDKIKDMAAAAWKWIKDIFKISLDWIVGAAEAAWDFIKDIFKISLDWIVDTATDAWNFIKDIFTTSLDFVVDAANTAWEAIKDAVQVVWDFLVMAFSAAIEFIKDLFFKFTPLGILISKFDKIKEIARAVWDFLVEAFGKAVEFIKDLFFKFTPLGILISKFDKIKEIAEGVRKWLSDKFQAAVNFIKKLFNPFAPLTFIQTKFDKIKSIATDAGQWVKDKFQAVIDFFKEMPAKIGRATSGMWDGIKTAFRASINWLITKWNNFQLRLGGQRVSLPFGLGFTIPSITLRTPNIPRIHTGGTFRAPRLGGEGLAVLRDGEKISSVTDSAPMIVQLVVDGRVLAESLIRHEEGLA